MKKFEWDGQWNAPHGDEDIDDDAMEKALFSKSNGLSLMGEDVEDTAFSSHTKQGGKVGFSKASDILAKYEVSGNGYRARLDPIPFPSFFSNTFAGARKT